MKSKINLIAALLTAGATFIPPIDMWTIACIWSSLLNFAFFLSAQFSKQP